MQFLKHVVETFSPSEYLENNLHFATYVNVPVPLVIFVDGHSYQRSILANRMSQRLHLLPWHATLQERHDCMFVKILKISLCTNLYIQLDKYASWKYILLCKFSNLTLI